MVCAFVLIDSRLEPQKIDVEFINYLGESGIPFCLIFTKADKLGKTQVQKNVAAYKKHLLANDWEEIPQYFVTSSADGTGREEILKYIGAVNDEINSGSQF